MRGKGVNFQYGGIAATKKRKPVESQQAWLTLERRFPQQYGASTVDIRNGKFTSLNKGGPNRNI